MYAVVEAGGRQYQLTSGRYIDVELVAGESQSEFVFDKVLMIVDGDKSMVGKPIVDGAKVTGKIIGHGKGQKLVVYKYRPKKGTRKRTGHRQGYTRIYIDSIKVGDKVLSEVKDQGKPQPKAAAEKKEAAPKAEKAPAKATKAPAKAAPKKAADKAAAPKKAAPKKTTKKEQ
jgi:large subunit ribosomal protein L21